VSEVKFSIAHDLASQLAKQRLGKNARGYFGETIDVRTVLDQLATAARTHGWNIEQLGGVSTPSGELAIPALTRLRTAPEGAHLRIYLSAGIHGDEPAGPLASVRLLQADRWPANVDVWFCPCLNPSGFLLNRRENGQGADLNRQYLEPTAPETLAHLEWLKRQPRFDLCLCLHEDWESHGFYVYELNPDGLRSLAEVMVTEVSRVCPIDLSENIEGRPARNGIIRPSADPRSRPQWPEAFFLLTHKTRLSYTLEAPSDFPLGMRVEALVTAVQAALQAFLEPKR
jgi:murein peptide amidase A